jgi:hypothetical protein
MVPETSIVDAWAYLVGCLVGLLLWVIIFCLRPDLRRRMLWVSFLLMPLGPIGERFFLVDYWRPPLILPIWYQGIEYGGLADLIFAFAAGGIAATAYPVVTRQLARRAMRATRRWLGFVFVGIMAGCIFFLPSAINSVVASILAFLLTAAVVCSVRPDLWLPALISGEVSALTLATVEAVMSLVAPQHLQRYWLLYNTRWGIVIAGHVPLIEVVWAAAFGVAVGPLYDACLGNDFGRQVPSRGQIVSGHPPINQEVRERRQ